VDQEEDQGDPVDRDVGSVDQDRVWDVHLWFAGTAACAGACAVG
jgi:hypothetical protein